MDFIKRNKLLSFIVFFAIIIYGVTAFNSHGFYYEDEHFQIIEFAGFKLGENTLNDLPWEFGARIRPTFQAIICYGFLKTFKELGINDPYTQAFILRLISALLSIAIILYFVKSTLHLISNKRHQLIYLLISLFLWFTPYTSVRFSSETWSGLFLILAIAVFLSTNKSKFKPFNVGLILGLSFLFRFQIALAILGFGLWIIFIYRAKLKYILKMGGAFIIILLLGLVIDSWFYGEIVFTPWKYFQANIIHDIASNYGVDPWYYYIKYNFHYPFHLIGEPILFALVLLLVTKPKNIFLWAIIPFIAGHSIIPHKEFRFMFPIFYLLPVVLIQAYIMLEGVMKNRYIRMVFNYSLLLLFVSSNAYGLFIKANKPAREGKIAMTKYIHEKYGDQKVNIIYCPVSNPFQPWPSLKNTFYFEKDMQSHRIDKLCLLDNSLLVKGATNLLLIRRSFRLDKDCSKVLEMSNFILEEQSLPKWIEKYNYSGFVHNEILELYRLKSKDDMIFDEDAVEIIKSEGLADSEELKHENLIQEFIETIKSNPEWLELIDKKAKENNISIEVAIRRDAEWLANKEKKIQKYIEQIKSNSAWLDSVKKKAKERNLTLEEAIRKDAEWLLDQENKKS